MKGENKQIQDTYYGHSHKRISWSAIFVGALVALGLGFLLNLFGIALGLSAFKTMNNGSVVVLVGGMLGIMAGLVVATLTAGYAAGYLGRFYCPEGNLGIMYGFLTWVVTLILAAALIGLLSQSLATYTSSFSRTIVSVPIEVNQISTPMGSTKISPSKKGSRDSLVEVNVNPANLASSAFVIFTMFLLGAVFTCIGAYWGMRHELEATSL